MIDYTGERAVPWNWHTGAELLYHHAARYAWALQFVQGKRVVDLGSGCGYGTFMLSWMAWRVMGLERDGEALAFASSRFMADNLMFVQTDLETGEIPVADAYVAFEVLEHLEHPEALIKRLEGTLLWSVPVLDDSQFHKHIYTPERAARLFGGAIWYQSVNGWIVPQGLADFVPRYVLGVRE